MTNISNTLRRWFVPTICGVLAFATAAHAQQFALRDGDTVVFYGDSITALRFYTKQVEEAVLTRYPLMHVRFVNAGVPGDSVYGGYAGRMVERVQRDVAPFNPTMITMMLGMNDGGWVPEDPKIDAIFSQGYRLLFDELRKVAPRAEITLIRPSPYDEVTHGTEFPSYSSVLDKNAEDVSRIAAELQASGDKNVLLADFHTPVMEALEKAKTQSPQLASLMLPDRIHPAEISQWIMTEALLSAWHVDPVVSRVALNARSGEVVDRARTKITSLEKSAKGLRWIQLDEALPLPLDFNNAMTHLLLQVSDIAKLDQQMLRIGSLEPGDYELLIDYKPIAIFSREELQRGVNLALYKTPMLDQSRGIDSSEDRIGFLDQARFILSAEVKQTSSSTSAETPLRQGEEELKATIRANLNPMPHHFELRHQ